MHIWKIKTASMFLCLPLHQAVVHSAPRGSLLKLKSHITFPFYYKNPISAIILRTETHLIRLPV